MKRSAIKPLHDGTVAESRNPTAPQLSLMVEKQCLFGPISSGSYANAGANVLVIRGAFMRLNQTWTWRTKLRYGRVPVIFDNEAPTTRKR